MPWKGNDSFSPRIVVHFAASMISIIALFSLFAGSVPPHTIGPSFA